MRMPMWMCGIMLKDKIRNEHMRGSVKVAHYRGAMVGMRHGSTNLKITTNPSIPYETAKVVWA